MRYFKNKDLQRILKTSSIQDPPKIEKMFHLVHCPNTHSQFYNIHSPPTLLMWM